MATIYGSEHKEESEFLKQSFNMTTRLYNKISSRLGERENFVISPFSVQSALALLYMGAAGTTADEIEDVLYKTKTDKRTSSLIFQQFLDFYGVRRIIKIVNAVFVNEERALNTDYKLLLKYKFHASIQNVNFQSEEAADIVNSWVREKTKNNITEVVNPSSFNENTNIFLINAVHFKGLWQNGFKKTDIKERDFWISIDVAKRAKMMCKTTDLNYKEFPELDATAIEMPYKNCSPVLIIVLPNHRDGLKELEKKIDEHLIHIACKLQRHRVSLQIPKFKIAFDIDLKKIIRLMGPSKMFSSGDFSLMLDSDAETSLTNFVHKILFEMEEEGSDVALTTSESCVDITKNANDPIEFVADHPFLFYVWDKKTILCFGRCYFPSN